MGIHLHMWDVDLPQLKTTKVLMIVEVNCGHARNFAEWQVVYISWISRN